MTQAAISSMTTVFSSKQCIGTVQCEFAITSFSYVMHSNMPSYEHHSSAQQNLMPYTMVHVEDPAIFLYET